MLQMAVTRSMFATAVSLLELGTSTAESILRRLAQVYRFREFMIKKFGNLIRGWVLCFDRDKSGVVSRKEFFDALHEVKSAWPAPRSSNWPHIPLHGVCKAARG